MPIERPTNKNFSRIPLLTWMILGCLLTILSAQEPEILFEEANQAYSGGDYHYAAELYQKIIDQNLASGETYFNLGNAYFKLDKVGLSILNYEKARQYLEGDQSLEHNLQLARLRIVDEIDEIPVLFLETWWLALIHLFPLNTSLWLSLFIFSILTLLLIIRMVLNTYRLKIPIWIMACLLFLTVLITAGQIYEFETSRFGIILDEQVSVVSEPGLGGKEVFILHEGTRVRVNRQLEDWLEVTIADGKTGWMKLSGLGII